MSRLASFKGPSTPSKAPVQRQGSLTPQQSPSTSANRQLESTFHRKTRTLLQELQSITETWDDLVLLDGLKAARKLIDTRTELECVYHHISNTVNQRRVEILYRYFQTGVPRLTLCIPR